MSRTKFGPWELAKHSESTVPKIVDRLPLLILILLLPYRNAFASINKRIVLTQPTVIQVSYDGFRWDYIEKVRTPNLNFIATNDTKRNTFSIPLLPRHSRIISRQLQDFMRKATGSQQIRFSILFSTTLSTQMPCQSITWIQNGGTENRCGSRIKKLLRRVLWCFGLVQK